MTQQFCVWHPYLQLDEWLDALNLREGVLPPFDGVGESPTQGRATPLAAPQICFPLVRNPAPLKFPCILTARWHCRSEIR